MGVGEGEGVARTRSGNDMARFIQHHIADIGRIVAAGAGEIHLARKGAVLPVKGVLTFTGVDHAAGHTAADINGVIAFTRLNGYGRVVDGLQGAGVGDFFIAVTAGINHRCAGAGRDNFAAIADGADVLRDDRRAACAVTYIDIGIGGERAIGIRANTAAFSLKDLNGIAFAYAQIARCFAAITLFKGEAGTFPVNVEDISLAVEIGHGECHAGADPCAIVGVNGHVAQQDIVVVGIVLNACASSIGADHHALRGQRTGFIGEANTVSGTVGGNTVTGNAINQ